jgi:hypothetical protein
MCGTDAANGANGTNGARPNNKVRLARLHQLPYHLIDVTTPSPQSHLPSVRWLPRYSHLYHHRAALSRRTRTSRPATTSQISPTSRSSSRLCVVRNRRHPFTPPTNPTTDSCDRGRAICQRLLRHRDQDQDVSVFMRMPNEAHGDFLLTFVFFG